MAALDAGVLVFDAPTDSRKIANLAQLSDIAFSVGPESGVSLQLEGTAAVVVIRVSWVPDYDANQHPATVEEAYRPK